ncbi:DUF6034 family protein [Christensenellaceae bacterium OttesenSCG-928-L17]|nr:DUF6034 family protein [Christensenellaceae bacterium OttesenSCG-928-L17]
MKSSKHIMFVLIFLLLLTACQPTPETDIVVSDKLQEEIITAPALSPYSFIVPHTWQESFSSKNLTVNIDVLLDIPEVNLYPVTQIVKEDSTEEIMRRMLQYFAQDAPVYAGERVWTKKEINEELMNIKAGTPKIGYYSFPKAREYGIESMESWLKDAPEAIEEVLVDALNDPLPRACYFYLSGGDGMGIWKGNDQSLLYMPMLGVGLYPEWLVEDGQVITGEPVGTKVGPFSMTKEEAIAQGEIVLHELGADYLKLGVVEKGRALNGHTVSVMHDGWHLTYRPQYGSLNAGQAAGSGGDEATYIPSFEAEELRMLINENGVHVIFWTNIAQRGEVVNANVQLMPFANVQSKAKQLMRNTFSWNELDEHVTYTVYNMELLSALVPVKDEPDMALTIPAWFITGRLAFEDSGDTRDEQLVISALDGRRIDRIG